MLRFILPAAALAGAILASAPAAASTMTAVDTGWQFSDSTVSGSFHDVFTFDLSQAGIVNATYSGTPSTLSITDYGIYSGNHEETTFQPFSYANNVFGGTDSVPLPAGTYTVDVTGSVSRGTAQYNGNVFVSSVPLPPTAALFGLSIVAVGGLGMIRSSRQRRCAAPVA